MSRSLTHGGFIHLWLDNPLELITAAQDLSARSIRDNTANIERSLQPLDRDFAMAAAFADTLVVEGTIPRSIVRPRA